MIGDVLLESGSSPASGTRSQLREPRGRTRGRGRRAARPRGGGFGTTASRLRGRPRRAGDRDVPARTAASQEPLARGLAAFPGARARDTEGSPNRCSLFRIASRPRRTRSQRSEPATVAAASRIEPTLRSTSPVVVRKLERRWHRGAACHSVAPSQQVALVLDAADDLTRDLVVVAEANEYLVSTTSFRISTPASAPSSSANRVAWSQQRSMRSATPPRPSDRSAAQTRSREHSRGFGHPVEGLRLDSLQIAAATAIAPPCESGCRQNNDTES